MENIQKFRKKGKKLGEYMMTKLRLLRDQKKYRSRGVTLKYMLDRVDSRDLIIVFSSCTRKGIRARFRTGLSRKLYGGGGAPVFSGTKPAGHWEY